MREEEEVMKENGSMKVMRLGKDKAAAISTLACLSVLGLAVVLLVKLINTPS